MRSIEFPVGTVVCKPLFVDLDPADRVPFLDPPLKWQGYITKGYQSAEREIRDLSLIQMDIMVKHENAPYGWVFGTFQYHGKKTGKASWENLVPVGLQWGNDPDATDDTSNPQPTRTIRNKRLKETVVNDDDELPPTHLGWNGRLNGPVDNPMSSCMSCHMTAATPQTRPISPLFQKDPPVPGSGPWMEWFQNLKPGTRFSPKAMPTDYSLQMAAGLQNFRTWRNEGSKLRYDDYKRSISKNKARDKGAQLEDPFRIPTHADDEGAGEARIRRNDPRPLPFP